MSFSAGLWEMKSFSFVQKYPYLTFIFQGYFYSILAFIIFYKKAAIILIIALLYEMLLLSLDAFKIFYLLLVFRIRL